MAPGPQVPLMSSSLFEYNRIPRDRSWAIIYLLFLGVTFGGGVFSFLNRNKRFEVLTSTEHLNNPRSCGVDNNGRQLLADHDELDVGDFVKLAGVWVLVSCALSALVGLLFLTLCKRSPEGMVRFTVFFQIGLPLAAAIASFVAGAWIAGIVLTCFALLVALVFFLWRAQLELVTKLIRVAATGLNDNPTIIWFVLVLELALAIVSVPILFAIIVSFMNGQLTRNSSVSSVSSKGDTCLDQSGNQVACCEWQIDAWVPAYAAIGGFTMLWTIFLAFEIKVFTISGTVAQWYFAPSNLARGATWTSFKHSLGPSFGSICFGSLILTIVDIARKAVRNASNSLNNNDNGFVVLVCCIFSAIASCLLALTEAVTKFATVRMAITGEAFLAAGRSIVDLLARNFLDAFGVWWFPPMILQCCSLALAAAWGVTIGLISHAVWQARHNHQAVQSAILLGIIAGVFCLMILGFLTSIILNIIDAVYICFAMDRDNRLVTRVEVHEVYMALPPVKAGPLVQNPDGQLAYAAPQLGQAPVSSGMQRPPNTV